MPGARCARRVCVGLAVAALVSLAPASVGASGPQQHGLYVAVGDSITAGTGASTAYKSWVQLYYGYLQSNGSGVTEVVNLGQPGKTSTDLRNEQLGRAVADVNVASSDTKAVTVDIGINDLHSDPNCPAANAPSCPFEGNLRAILAAMKSALANDPGEETLQVMEYYNPDIATPNESAMRQLLVGSDGQVNCSGTGAAQGLNDLIHCIGVEQGAATIDVLPIFDAAGPAFLAPDHAHPNDAGHLAIAKAFGGAATPTEPPPLSSPPRLRASKPKLSRATAGKPFTAWMVVTNADTGKKVKGRVSCQGKLSGKSLRARSHSSASSGRSSCKWQLPAGAHNKQFKGSITSRFQGSNISRSFSTHAK
jgi:lysophospholipase L1-like esterase